MDDERDVGVRVTARIAWVDTDASGHHHNSVILRLVEGAEAELIRELGLDGYWPAAPRVRQEVDYESPLWFDQEVTTSLWVERLGRSSLSYRFEVWGEGPARLRAAAGRVIVAHVPGRGAGARPWPPAWAAKLLPPRGE
ncbi:acyl-CoA thioesterase [Kineosporia succinea]|uniref:Acyl-CoA thioester hydrolase n=1 Tax=Kineosporia succinea TaxID=84632 RepID=A0ABT9PAS5_9ACTN|nr:thioesterase family protein [Kineosporia succinea]MDP9829796.1 acyl-CoA thioester hydrolase [Kineosporia succinea]